MSQLDLFGFKDTYDAVLKLHDMVGATRCELHCGNDRRSLAIYMINKKNWLKGADGVGFFISIYLDAQPGKVNYKIDMEHEKNGKIIEVSVRKYEVSVDKLVDVCLSDFLEMKEMLE